MPEMLITREAIERRINDALIEFGVEAGASRLDASWEEIDVDSLDLVELAQIIEEEYGVELRQKDLEGMQTVRGAIDLVSARLA